MTKQTQTTVDSGDVPAVEPEDRTRATEAKAREILEAMSDEVTDEQAAETWPAREVERAGDLGLGGYLVRKTDEEADPAQMAYRAIVEQILGAATIEDVLTPVEAVNARDILNTPIVVYGFTAQRSEYDVGSPYYASIDATVIDTDERLVVNTGNQAVLAQLVSLQTKNAFPVPVKFIERGRPNRVGDLPLRLVKPDWEPRA